MPTILEARPKSGANTTYHSKHTFQKLKPQRIIDLEPVNEIEMDMDPGDLDGHLTMSYGDQKAHIKNSSRPLTAMVRGQNKNNTNSKFLKNNMVER